MKFIYLIFISFFLSSCATTNSNYKQLVKPVTFITAKEILDKNPKNASKLLIIADSLDILAGSINKNLTLEDFKKITDKAGKDPEWAVLGSYIYDIYKDKIVTTDDLKEVAKILQDISAALRDAVLLVKNSK